MNTRVSSEPNGFELNLPELVKLSAVLSALDRFPPALLELSRFPATDLEAAFMQDGPISPEQIIVGAYFGYAPFPATYMKFVDHAERLNRQRNDKEKAAELMGKRNAAARDGEAALGFGYADRRAIKQTYRELDELAIAYGFESFESIIDWPKGLFERTSAFSVEEHKAFASGPLFLYDLASRARSVKLPRVVFGAYNGWVLLAHVENNVATLHAFNGSDIWHKGFAPRKVIRCFPESLGDLPPLMPEAVYDALMRLHHGHFPACKPDLVLPQSSVDIEFDLGS